jgi:hypothetical protein
MNLSKGTTMTNMTRRSSLALILLFACSAVLAASTRQDASLGKDSVLLKPFNHPYAASHAEWTAAARVFATTMKAHSGGPSDAGSRAAVFEYIDGKLSLDYERLCAIWTNGRSGSGDGCASEEEHAMLRGYLDEIVDPARDEQYTGMILKHGNGVAIAKFGPTVKSRVLDMAAEPQAGEPFHDPQVEAFRALGYWLSGSDNRFTADEKEQFTTLLLHALPPADSVAGGRETLMARTILQALSNSSRPDVAQTLRTWAQVNQATRSYASPLAVSAKTAATAVEKHVQRDR